MRDIRIHIEGAEMEALNERTGGGFSKAIAKYALWGAETYPFVSVFSDGGSDLMAAYHKEAPNERQRPGFVLAAIWDAASNTYSYHS